MAQPWVTRLFVPFGITAGASVDLGEAKAHRLRNVLRLGPGALVSAFNAVDGEWLCRISEIGRTRVSLVAERQLRAGEPEPNLWLVFAPIHRSRLDWMIEKATEFGVSALVPVVSARVQGPWLDAASTRKRLEAIAIAAAEQCERLSVPQIHPHSRIEEMLRRWESFRRLIVCDETGRGVPIAEALTDFAAETPAAILVGPEGGFADTELDALANLPFVTRVSLGPRVLRAETAALAALAAYQAIAGDWRRTRPR
jgi:16S rRNA (uracil1498-N3)-methyltransferase